MVAAVRGLRVYRVSEFRALNHRPTTPEPTPYTLYLTRLEHPLR